MRGGALIEFALLLPFLAFMHFAVVEFVQGWQAQARVTHVAAALADVTSQSRSLTDNELIDILLAGNVIMRPFPVEPLSQRITSISRGADGRVSVDWTIDRDFPDDAAPTLPDNFLANNESAIVAEAIYEYRPQISTFFLDSFTLRHLAVTRPRISAKVERR